MAVDNNGLLQDRKYQVPYPIQDFVPPVEEFEGPCDFGDEGDNTSAYVCSAI